MNRSSLVHKAIYAVLIGVLLFPLSYYGQPATVATSNEPASPGGKLAQLREQQHLSQAGLGEIDPAGETIKLATLGLRGVAACLLWHEANEAKKKENWTGMRTVLDQLTKLEPNYALVWRHQAWNVSYNIAVEFDDYHDRYFWIKEGIKYLLKGARYNENDPRLITDIGGTTGRKIGVADEKLEYRVLFRDDVDPEFPDHDNVTSHRKAGPRTVDHRDNWLVGQEYYNQAIEMVENRSLSLKTLSPVLFYVEPGKAQINYADALEQDGIFGERAKFAWEDASRMWEEYGQREMAVGRGQLIRLADQEQLEADIKTLKEELEALSPGLRDRIAEEKKAKMPEDDRRILDAGPGGMAPNEQQRAFEVYSKSQVSHQEVANAIEGDKKNRAREITQELTRKENQVSAIASNRDTVNFPYWRLRSKMEATAEGLEGRRLLYEAHEAYHTKTDLPGAKAAYEKGFAQFRIVYDNFPDLKGDAFGGENMLDSLMDYHDVLNKLELLGPDEQFPEDFILMDVVEILMRRGQLLPPGHPGREPPAGQQGGPGGGKPPERPPQRID